MSVITNKYEDHPCYRHSSERRGNCSECKEPLHYPFLEWNNEVHFCGKCCQRIKKGFTADLIHVAAIMDLRDVGYRQETFIRKSMKYVEDQGAKREAEENQIIKDLNNCK